MEETFLKFDHVGVIVRNMDKAIDYYEALGIGPFVSSKGPPPYNRKVYGKSADDVKNLRMVAQMGPIKFELIQPVSGKSVQREFLGKHGSAKLTDGGGSAYFDTDKTGGVVIEFEERHSGF